MVAATASIGYLAPVCRVLQPVNRARVVITYPEELAPLTEEDVRIHAWLNQRLAIVARERRGLWATLRRWFGINR